MPHTYLYATVLEFSPALLNLQSCLQCALASPEPAGNIILGLFTRRSFEDNLRLIELD
jgi:hypothetical protein